MGEETFELKAAHMRKGLVEFCTLLAVSDGRVYSSDILKKMKSADMLVVEGTLYPLLSRLKAQGLLEYDWEESRTGPPRKYYQLTQKGTETLAQYRKQWGELVASVSSLAK